MGTCRMVKKLESGLTTEVTTPPSPTLRLACCPSPPAYSTSSESRTGGGGEAYELEDLPGIHYGKLSTRKLLLRNEYLVTENRILRDQMKGRLRLSDGERKALADIGQKLGKQALKAVAKIVTPDTMLGWHRKFAAQKFDGSKQRKALGRPTIDHGLEALVVAYGTREPLVGL